MANGVYIKLLCRKLTSILTKAGFTLMQITCSEQLHKCLRETMSEYSYSRY